MIWFYICNSIFIFKPVMTTSHDISHGLVTKTFGKKLFVFETIDSTNSCARLLAECGVEEGTVIYAEEQTSGRGRLKRKWYAEKGENLLFSIIFSPDIKERRYYLIPLLVSVCIVDSIRVHVPDCETTVKWPNDILLASGAKIGGILTELTRTFKDDLRIVVGIGINVNQTKFPSGIASTASSIKLAVDRDIDRYVLLREILSCIELNYDSVHSNPESIIDRWRSYCTMFGKPVRVLQGKNVQTGICRDIDPDGALIIENNRGKTMRILAGDVSSVSFNNH
jgi:BirA family transcriptional regulator, biotin operon repressor / biotin---[acetyl-CoA-carboxylase] ligase